MAAKRPPDESSTTIFCCSIIYSQESPSNERITIRLYSFERDYTWHGVLMELPEEKPTNMPLGKADTVTVCVSAKMNGSKMFYPDFEEPADIVKLFDKELKYVTFKVNQYNQPQQC